MIKNLLLFAMGLLLWSGGLYSQNLDEKYREHVKSVDSILESLYGVISGDAGEKRDWELFKYLFTEDAQLIPSGKNKEGKQTIMYMTPNDYVNNSGPYLEKNGFFEKEIFRVSENFGQIMHVFSTYESYRTSTDTEPFARGINSIQLFHDGNRWWIVNIFWTGERPNQPLPGKYLPK